MKKEQGKALKAALDDTVQGLGSFYAREESRETVGRYLKGLLSRVERKNSWQLAEEMGLENPYRLQHLLDRAIWNEEAVRDFHMDRVMSNLGSSRGTLIVDETGFLKKGSMSAGVARQYSGTAGRIENCQIGVFLAWSTPTEHTLIDRELYIPKDWFADEERLKKARIPIERKFATKISLGQDMIGRALARGFHPEWVVADEVYGRDYKFRKFLEDHHLSYVLAVSKDQSVCQGWQKVPANLLCSSLEEVEWHTMKCGDGTKGTRLYDWALLALNTPSLESRRWLLIRRSLKDPTDMAYYLVFALKELSLQEIVLAAGKRWAIEECFETAKGEVGLDHYEVRSYRGWARHMTLAMVAHALLVITKNKLFSASSFSSPMVVFKKKRGLL